MDIFFDSGREALVFVFFLEQFAERKGQVLTQLKGKMLFKFFVQLPQLFGIRFRRQGEAGF